MGRNSHYWVDKNTKSIEAQQHTDRVATCYKDEIQHSIDQTRIYTDEMPEVDVISTDSVDACFRYDGKICVLNFASFKEPGGGFLQGSTAQEECLCHESTLYNVISTQSDFYEYNKEHLNKALYSNRALYSPDVVFDHNGESKLIDVITCAAPNYVAASKYCYVTKQENVRALRSRIRFIMSIISREQPDVAVLGAFGCGVFGQDPTDVANIFKREIQITFGSNSKTKFVFAIYDRDEAKTNYTAFVEVFDKNLH